MRIVERFGFYWRHVSDGLQQSPVVEPVDPFESSELDGFERAPRPAPVDDLSLEQPDHRFREGVVVGIPNTAHGRFDPGLGQALRVLDQGV